MSLNLCGPPACSRGLSPSCFQGQLSGLAPSCWPVPGRLTHPAQVDCARHSLYCADELIPAPAALTAALYPLTRGVPLLVSSEQLPERSNQRQPYCRGSDRRRGPGVTAPGVGGAGGGRRSHAVGTAFKGIQQNPFILLKRTRRPWEPGTCTRSPRDDTAPASGGQAGLTSLDSGDS